MRKLPKADIERKVNDAAKLLDISHLLDRKPRELSGGQQQRVALGRALVRDPAVFLMDEPLSNLDAKLRVQMRSEIKRFHHNLNATVVYVTHDQLEAVTMADKMAVMNGGPAAAI
jgi:multiple sugar transport system ATP-binding protein